MQQYLRAIREPGGAISSNIILSAARGIVLKTSQTLLAEYGGHVVLTKDWAKTLLQRMGFVKRRGTTGKSKNLVEHFNELKVRGKDLPWLTCDGRETVPLTAEVGTNTEPIETTEVGTRTVQDQLTEVTIPPKTKVPVKRKPIFLKWDCPLKGYAS